MIHIPHRAARRLIEIVLPHAILRRLPRRTQTAIWAKVHGPLRHARAFPGIDREWIAYDALRKALAASMERICVLEFGCASGRFTERLLTFIEALGASDRADVIAFDTFSGMPAPDGNADALPYSPFSKGQPWIEGSFASDERSVASRLAGQGFRNFRLVKGRFDQSLTDDMIQQIEQPALVVVDCDYYSSTREVLKRLLPACPSGCVFYFDDVWFNFYSRRSGELRAIDDVNSGAFGAQFEMVEDLRLGMLSRRVYRLVRHDAGHDTRTNIAWLGD